MFTAEIVQLTQQALWLVLILAAPPVLAAAISGLIVAFVQAATQLQEQTLQFAVKFFAVTVTLFITTALAGSTLFQYTNRIFSDFPRLVSGG